MIILVKDKKNDKLSRGIVDTTMSVKIAQVLSFIDCLERNKQIINNTNLDTVRDQELAGNKKYQKRDD